MEQIYVAQGRGGLLKVGRTTNLKKRLAQLRKEFVRKGDVLVRTEACEPVLDGYGPEFRLIAVLVQHCKQHSGREWFIDASFENALRAAREICDDARPRQIAQREYEATPQGKAAATRFRKEMARLRAERQKAKEAYAARKAAYAAEASRRKFERQRRLLGPMELVIAGLLVQRANEAA